MAEPAKPLKKGLEAIVNGLLDLDDPAPIAPKPPAPVNSGVIQDRPAGLKPSTMPTRGGKARGVYRGPIVPKGSQIAPKRESSADYIDGRADRATHRNSRLNLSISEAHLNAFKWGARLTRQAYNDLFEAWVEANFPQQYKDILEAMEDDRLETN